MKPNLKLTKLLLIHFNKIYFHVNKHMFTYFIMNVRSCEEGLKNATASQLWHARLACTITAL